VSRYQKKPSPTHIHEEEAFAQTTKSTASEKTTKSQLDGRLKLTASAFNRLWISMLADLGPDLQNILQQSYDNAKVTINLR